VVVKSIQQVWRDKVKLDVGRKKILCEKWDRKREALIKQYQRKGGKYHQLIRSLKGLSPNIRDQAMAKYYNTAKQRYMTTLSRWLKKRSKLSTASFSWCDSR
jgi:hypothetical protein